MPHSTPDTTPDSVPNTAPDAAADIAALDALTADFFAAFDNRGGMPADVGRVRRLMLPKGVVVITRPEFTVLSVDEFVAPREKLLSGGRLVEFSEQETSARTEVVGDLATRFLEYRKSGLLDGAPYEGGGTKTIQYVRTPDGWRISAFAWFDNA